MHSLPIFVRLANRPVMLLGEGATADAKRRLLERAGARIVGEEAEAALAIVAMEDEEEAHAATGRLKARGVLVNAVDRPALCDFTLPAIVDRDPVLLAIGTGGASAGLAKALRQRIEAWLPASLGRLAEALYDAQTRLRAAVPEADARRRAIDAALDPGGPLDPFAGGWDVDRWLGDPAAPAEPATVRIRLRSPDPDELTLREARWLARADAVRAEPGVPAAVLARVRADAARVVAGESVPGLVVEITAPD